MYACYLCAVTVCEQDICQGVTILCSCSLNLDVVLLIKHVAVSTVYHLPKQGSRSPASILSNKCDNMDIFLHCVFWGLLVLFLPVLFIQMCSWVGIT